MFPDLTRDDVFRIETRRLWLRWPRAADAKAIVDLAGEREVAEMTARIPHPIDPLGIDAFLIESRRVNTEGEGLVMAIAARAAPTTLIGIVSVEADPEADGPHLGYWLGKAFWGQGLMSEAAGALTDAYFGYAGGTVLTSDTLLANPASGSVLTKCGFVQTESRLRSFPARGGNRPVHTFRLSREVWSSRRAEAFGLSESDG